MRNIKTREIMMNMSLHTNYINSSTIYILLNSKGLDYYIKNVSIEETVINYKSSVKKRILNSNEQFLDLLDHFIMWFTDEFYFIEKTKMLMLETILNYHQNDEYLCSKKGFR